MHEVSRTRTFFLRRLGDPADQAAWEDFDRRYRPIIVGFARRLGFGDADAADVAQDATMRFVQEYRAGRYDRDRGRLRTWLLEMVRTRAAMTRRRAARRGPGRGDSAIVDCADRRGMITAWDDERQREILRQALREVRDGSRIGERTLRAFEALCVHRLPPAVVAEELGMTVGDVYLAKCRVAQRLRTIVARLESEYPS